MGDAFFFAPFFSFFLLRFALGLGLIIVHNVLSCSPTSEITLCLSVYVTTCNILVLDVIADFKLPFLLADILEALMGFRARLGRCFTFLLYLFRVSGCIIIIHIF